MGAALIPIAAQALGGGLQALFSGTRKRQKELEALTNQSPTYGGGGSIRDYYNKALSRYNVNPYTGTLYQTSLQNAQRTTNQGLSALQDRRSALSGIGKLMALQNDANLKAGIAAENEQARRFSQLGSAASANAAEDKYQYQQNQLSPYLRRLQLAQQKAGGAAAVKQAGLTNIFGALNNASYLLGGGNATTPQTQSQGVNIPTLKRDAAITAPSALSMFKRRNNQSISDAQYEDIPDYNYLDRGIINN